jgi:hypothetical protein
MVNRSRFCVHHNRCSGNNYNEQHNNYSGDNNNMGIYNNIHDINDEQFYHCTLNDCACHSRTDYFDTSNNFNINHNDNTDTTT